MKNLKRLLSLALTGVMLSGMMVMGASAANFGDADEIVNTEAVDTMVALNIINGKPDGNYDPNGLVTRAEMAKMIATAVNGGVAPEFGTKPVPTYSDIKGNWAEQFIEYCYDMKYISGRGNGTFDPAGNVTGVEAAKMVLTALGYDETAYQLKGADWAINTNAIAIRTCKPSLYENLNGINMNVAIDRDTAAQIIWNGVQNHVVEWTPNREVTGTGLNYQYTINPKVTLLNRAYDAYIWVGTFVANDKFGGTGLAKGEIQVTGDLEDADPRTSTPAKFPAEYDIANIGEETKVIFKDGKGGTKGQPDRNDTIYGVFNTGASNVITGIQADVKDQKSDKVQINIGGTTYETADAVDVYTNYVLTGDDLDATNGSKTGGVDGKGVNSTLTDAIKGTNGNTIKAVVDPATDEITTIYITASKIAAVTATNSTKISLNNGVGTIEIADNDVEEGLKKGDVVVATTLYQANASDDGAYTIVKKAETVSGEVDGYKDAETVTVDGTKYKICNKADLLSSIPEAKASDVIKTFNGTNNKYIGEDVTLYMVNGYVGAAIQTSESANNYSLVTEVSNSTDASGATFYALQLQVMDAEGNKTIITVGNSGKTGSDYSVGDIVTYTMGKDGKADVKVEAEIDTASKAEYDDDVKTFGVTSTKGTVTSTDCVLFVQTENKAYNAQKWTDAKFKVYNIRDLKEFTAAGTGITTVTLDGKVVAAFANYAQDKTPAGATSNTVYGIVSEVGGRVKDYFTYTVEANGETYTVNSKDNSLKKGNLVYFDLASDNNYADSSANPNSGKGDVKVVALGADAKAVYTKEFDGDTLTFYTSVVKVDDRFEGAGQDTLALEKDAPVVYVDKDKSSSKAENTIGSFDSVTGYANALLLTVTEGSGASAKTTIKAIFVETSNKQDIITVTKSLSANDIKGLADGVYTPTTVAGDAFSTSVTDPAKLRVFKFTADNNRYFKIVVKTAAGVEVYNEPGDIGAADTEAHYFYLAVGDLSKLTIGTKADVWAGTATEAPAGTYTYEIFSSADNSTFGTTAISSGSFTY